MHEASTKYTIGIWLWVFPPCGNFTFSHNQDQTILSRGGWSGEIENKASLIPAELEPESELGNVSEVWQAILPTIPDMTRQEPGMQSNLVRYLWNCITITITAHTVCHIKDTELDHLETD